MLNVQKMIQDAEKCLGWPYVSPGTNDQNGIDCSGLFVRIFREQGYKIAHGSNTIYRNYCIKKGLITNPSELIPGMAVFKWNPNTPEKFHDDLGDFQHIGLVISGSPLRIIHASSAAGCVVIDENIGKWKYWGMLTDVDYEGAGDIPADSDLPEVQYAIVHSENGKPVKMRFRPNTDCNLYENVPDGAQVAVSDYKPDSWSKVSYGNRFDWYMMSKFLKPVGSENDGTGENESGNEDTPAEPDSPVVKFARVYAENGKPVKMREEPSTKCRMYENVPNGTIIPVLDYGEEWSKVSFGSRVGWYMMSKFLILEENGYG